MWERAKSLEKVNLPDGKYFGLWSGYVINIVLPDWEKIDIDVNQGVRGINCKCTVEIIDGWLYEVTK